ncbi:MAG: rhodanese-like domain-containing protein [Verrucomicrobiales bacterium]|nr:rhodanese-like domain-containing protein [Verrucomicrobiales bacterium]
MSPTSLIIIGSLIFVVLLWHLFEFAWDNGHFKTYENGGFARNLHTPAALRVFKQLPELTPVDVRPRGQFEKRHLPGAINAPFEDGILDATGMDELDRSTPILVYCEGGYRSRRALPCLIEKGFTKVYHINRGIKMWRFFGGVCETEDPSTTPDTA